MQKSGRQKLAQYKKSMYTLPPCKQRGLIHMFVLNGKNTYAMSLLSNEFKCNHCVITVSCLLYIILIDIEQDMKLMCNKTKC